MSLALKDAVEQIPDASCDYYYLSDNDYKAASAPWVYRFFSFTETMYVLKKKFRGFNLGSSKLIIFQSYDLSLYFKGNFGNARSLIYLDSTPYLAQKLIRSNTSNPIKIFKSYLLSSAKSFIARRTFNKVDHFITLSQWCAESLSKDYNIASSRITPVYIGLDLERWKPNPQKSENEKTKLLFVGNDFLRKGGLFLLNLYSRYLSETCTLDIVSNDPTLNHLTLDKGVTLHFGLTQTDQERIIEIYQSCDIFVFPSRQDQLGIVIAEALAVGMPVISSEVGATKELVINGVNGYLMSDNHTELDWAEKIGNLHSNKQLAQNFGKQSRDLAVRLLDKQKFNNTVYNIVKELLEK